MSAAPSPFTMPSAKPFDAYVKVEGVPGDAKDAQHKDWIEVLDFNHSFTQPASATVNSAGGGTVGRVVMNSFEVQKRIDKASPKLYEYCCSGKHLASVTVEMMRASGDSRVKYMEIKMEEVVVAAVQSNGHERSSDGFPIETIGFNFAKIKWTYTEQKRSDGSVGGSIPGGWNLEENKSNA